MSSEESETSEPTCTLSTSSGALLDWGTADSNSFLEPLTLDTSSLRELAADQWVEIRPNGFRLYYGEPAAFESVAGGDSEGGSVPSIATECPDLERSLGFQRNLLPVLSRAPFVGIPVSVRQGPGQSGQPKLCAVDELDAGLPVFSANGQTTAMDLAEGWAPTIRKECDGPCSELRQ